VVEADGEAVTGVAKYDDDENPSDLERMVWETADRIASEITEMLKHLPADANHERACEMLAWALTRELPIIEKWASAHVAFEKIIEEYGAGNEALPAEKAER
jgi:hypothetical protein